MEIANEILRQLGGGKFLAMTGAKNLIGHERALSLRIPMRTKNGANYLKITLTHRDTYDMEFGSVRGVKYTVKGRLTDVYNDQLRPVFEAETGLYTSLGTMGR